MTKDTLNYTNMIDHAMRGVVREVLRQVSRGGLPGEHHFYISFATQHPGVTMSEQLRSRYPQEITIVLQHQFWDFKVEEDLFTVTLSFSGIPEKLIVPYAALTAFADPSVKFGLQFQQNEPDDAATSMDLLQDLEAHSPVARDVALLAEDGEGAAEIISLDSFRKK
jgi:hypothetical protein